MHYIYLHGFCSSPNSAKGRYFRERFAESGIELAVPDLNAGGFESLTISRMLEQVEQCAEGFAGELTLFGSSLGAYVAILYALQTRRVSRLVLLAPAVGFIERHRRNAEPGFFEEWEESGSAEFFHHGYEKNMPLHFEFVRDAEAYASRNLAGDIPTIAFQGLHDEVVPAEAALQYLRLNRAAELVLLHSDHQLRDCTERIWEYTRAFLGLQQGTTAGG